MHAWACVSSHTGWLAAHSGEELRAAARLSASTRLVSLCGDANAPTHAIVEASLPAVGLLDGLWRASSILLAAAECDGSLLQPPHSSNPYLPPPSHPPNPTTTPPSSPATTTYHRHHHTPSCHVVTKASLPAPPRSPKELLSRGSAPGSDSAFLCAMTHWSPCPVAYDDLLPELQACSTSCNLLPPAVSSAPRRPCSSAWNAWRL